MVTVPTHLCFAESALDAYDMGTGITARLISLSENATFLVERDSECLGVLRVYRPEYQSRASMDSELSWIEALRDSELVRTPAIVATKRGEKLHSIAVGGHERYCVMFEYVHGHELTEDDLSTYTAVGRTAALLHGHVQQWSPPEAFTRTVWDLDAILGADAPWGDWREGPGHSAEGLNLLERAETMLRGRLSSYPLSSTNSGLVHGDLRAANLMSDATGELWVIDFDDAGFSWFLWDLCSTTTFIEHLPIVDDVVDAWIAGYTQLRPLDSADLAIIPDLVFLRRLHLLAWLGTHPESDLAASLGNSYTNATYEVAHRYLIRNFLPRAQASNDG